MSFAHEVMAQVEATVPGGISAVLFGYGPLGAFCWWLTRLVDRLRRELAQRDELLREVTDKHVAALANATHKISGLSRALVYNAATHGPDGVRKLAQREIDRWERGGE